MSLTDPTRTVQPSGTRGARPTRAGQLEQAGALLAALRDALEQEQAALEHSDCDALREITTVKCALVEQLTPLADVVERVLASVRQRDNPLVSLKEEADQQQSQAEALRGLVEYCASLNARNGELATTRVNGTQHLIELIESQRAGNPEPHYGAPRRAGDTRGAINSRYISYLT